MVDIPEYRATVMVTSHAILPECLLHALALVLIPRKSAKPKREWVLVIPTHQLLHPAALHRHRWQWRRYWSGWWWCPIQRNIINVDAILPADVANGIGKCHVLRVHQELHGTAFGIAHKAAVGVAVILLADGRWPHDKVSVVAVFVKRAQARHVHASFAERHEVAHDVLDLRFVEHRIDDVVADFRHKLKMDNM